MDSALATLRGSGNAPWSLRREVLRTLGILGALDPYKYRSVRSHVSVCIYLCGLTANVHTYVKREVLATLGILGALDPYKCTGLYAYIYLCVSVWAYS